MRPDPDSDLAGAQSEYGDDTGFAAEATRSNPEVTQADTDAEHAGGAADETEQAVSADGPGAGGD